jgi:uncharacterized protein (TIGR00251 family)
MSEELSIERHGEYACLQVLLQPRSSRNEICGLLGQVLKVRVTSPPVDDRANEQLVAFLAETVGLPRRDVAIVRGHRSRRKTVGFKGLAPEELARRLRNMW